MGLILMFSIVITAGVLMFQLAFFAGGLIALCYVAAQYVPLKIKQQFISRSIWLVVALTTVIYVILFWTYCSYITAHAACCEPVPDNAANRYWKENLGQDTIGTVSFMNPILSPLLYLLPHDKSVKSVSD
jgi:hypothetical protein